VANKLLNQPMIVDTDITTWRNAAAVVAAGYTTGIRVQKIALVVDAGGAATAGEVTITAPSDSSLLYFPILVGTQAAYTTIYESNPTEPYGSLAWRDFAVTGVTATGTRLFIWWSQ
jgi:hypothetical protein